MANSSTPLLSRASALPNSTFLWRSGALLVAAGMITGAFGAHALKGRLTPEALNTWKSGASYAVYNGLGLLLVSLHPRFAGHRFAGPAILGGGLLFSGSIFGLVLAKDRFKYLGPVTPFGGMLMIAGYLSLAL